MIGVVARLLRWASRLLGFHNLLALGLLVIIVITVAAGIVGAVEGLDALLLIAVALLGMLVGWGLASTPLSAWKANGLSFVSGFVVLFLRVGRLGRDLVALAQALIALFAKACLWVLLLVILREPPNFALPWTPVPTALAGLWNDVSVLMLRVYTWLQSVITGEPAFDPVAATLVWGLGLWLVAAWAAWMLRRHARPLLAIAPAGVLLLATLSYNWGNTLGILVLLGAALLLFALTAYTVRQRRWLAAGIDSPALGSETTVAVILVSSVLVISAAVAPSIVFRDIVEFVERLGSGQAAGEGDLGDLPRQVVPPSQMEKSHFGDLRQGGLPRSHLLGSGPELSRHVVMLISTGQFPPNLPEGISVDVPRYYWRSISYDVYTGRGWKTGAPETVDYQAGVTLTVTTFEAQREMRQDVRIIGDVGGLLHAAGALLSVDQDYTVAWRSPEDMFGATLESTSYRAVSLVSGATEEQLRAAGSDYPEWVRARYLPLPDTVSDRVVGLARDLTATEPTPYDRAIAIEAYLRKYSYNLDVPLPPPDVTDVADYFLFELREGYCDYYATSMVVLARAAGLPARLAMGYTSGTYDFYDAVYRVTEADAHAWVEIYFPNYGWINFEPTGGLPAIRRYSQIDLPPDLPAAGESPESTGIGWGELGRLAQLAWWILPILPLLAGGIWLALDDWRLRRLGTSRAVATLYGRLRHHGQRLAVPMRAGDTPYEFAEVFAEWSKKQARKERWGMVLADAVSEVRRLVDLYVKVAYTARPVGSIELWYAFQSWRKLRWRLCFARILQGRRSLSEKSRRAPG
ncbi:MAG: transglutaminase domain-containing protein [Anaerolineae bacterium]|nr:transglutaminase domain-containing protein [Anaerolineae bacterium]